MWSVSLAPLKKVEEVGSERRDLISYSPGWSEWSTEQLVLPQKLQRGVKTALHDETGHLGFERTFALIRECFYWPRMFQDVTVCRKV